MPWRQKNRRIILKPVTKCSVVPATKPRLGTLPIPITKKTRGSGSSAICFRAFTILPSGRNLSRRIQIAFFPGISGPKPTAGWSIKFGTFAHTTLMSWRAPRALHANPTIGASNAPGEATQTIFELFRRMDMRPLGGPIKSGHDNGGTAPPYNISNADLRAGGLKALSSVTISSSLNFTSAAFMFSRTCSTRPDFGMTMVFG
jgi:hypothetical protein